MKGDKYRWMEVESPELRAWVEEQHEQAMAQLSSLTVREQIRRRLEALIRTDAIGERTKAGKRYFFRQRLAGNELAALYFQDESNAEPQVLVNPEELSTNGAITLADVHPSRDGSLIAYRLSEAGSSCMSLHVMNVGARQVLEVIAGEVNPVAHAWHTKNRVAWLPDNTGFYYTRCTAAVSPAEARFNHKLYFHRLGNDWRDDELVFGDLLRREQTLYPQLSADGRYLIVLVQDMSGTTPWSDLYVLDREQPERGFVPIITGTEAFIGGAACHRDTLYIQTNHQAPFGKLIAVKLDDDSSVSTVIPQQKHPLRSWTICTDLLFIETLENVSSSLCAYDLSGKFIHQIGLPGIGSIDCLRAESNALFLSFSSFLTPKSVYRLDLESFELSLEEQLNVPFDPAQFEIDQVWFESRDHTRVPMFLIHKRGLERDGRNAAVIHGYGGFGVSMLPAFIPHAIPFLESGGVYAVVNTRGGGEFGEAWHRAGMRANRQNVFADFIAAGEWLIAEGYTRASKLGCMGWSNGGLTVNAVAVQRPDLWKAVVAGAPVTDMARFHKAHGGRNWIADYGSPEDTDDLSFLMQYSPYHTLPERIDAPAILTIVPDNDDRVAPWHGYKMHAAWRAANTSTNPILLRAEKSAGHRGSPSAGRTIDRYADIWAFFFWQLGVSRART